MVAPVTGPIHRSITRLGPPNVSGFRPDWFNRESDWYRQKKPYNLVLGYSVDVIEVLWNDDPLGHTIGTNNCYPSDGASITACRNKAYAKLKDNVGAQALWAVNIAERSQAFAMIAKRANTLIQFTRALKRGDFLKASKTLKVKTSNRLRNLQKRRGTRELDLRPGSKELGDLWLEYHFGWEPLVKDIYESTKILSRPLKPPKRRVEGRAIDRRKTFFRSADTPFWLFTQKFVETRVSMSMDIVVSNPQLHLADQLGLINPLLVAWELVPFSFVVDWFVNVGQVLSSFTDFAGLERSNERTSTLQNVTGTYQNYQGYTYGTHRMSFQRQGLISGPVLAIAPWKGVSPTRGLTAISLLTQQLGR